MSTLALRVDVRKVNPTCGHGEWQLWRRKRTLELASIILSTGGFVPEADPQAKAESPLAQLNYQR